jgi:hypothetical protein
MRQSLQHRLQVGGAGRLRPLPHSGQGCAARTGSGGQEIVQPLGLVRSEVADQAGEGLAACLRPGRERDALQRGGRRQHDPRLAQETRHGPTITSPCREAGVLLMYARNMSYYLSIQDIFSQPTPHL